MTMINCRIMIGGKCQGRGANRYESPGSDLRPIMAPLMLAFSVKHHAAGSSRGRSCSAKDLEQICEHALTMIAPHGRIII